VKTRKAISFAAAVFLLIAVMMFAAASAMATATYEPSEIKTVRAYYVNDLGRISGQFTSGTLQKGDFAFLRLPSDFIWTTAGINSDQTVAAAAYQTTEEWNTIEAASGYVKYGTSNFIRVPAQCSGNDNGLYKGSTPVLRFTRQSDNEVLMEVMEDLDPGLECCLDINAARVYVDKGAGQYVSLTIDAPAGSGFDSDAGFYNRLECVDMPPVYTGIPGQKIGTLVIHEAEAGRFKEGQVLILELPDGARWGKLAADSGSNITVSGSVSDGGRTAKFRFSGESATAVEFELKDMEVELEPGLTGWLKVKVSGSAGLAGDLTVAKITNPAAVFTVDKTEFEINGTENTMDVAPYIKGDRVYLPVRFIARAVDITDDNIIWNQDEQSVEIRNYGRVVKLVISSDTMVVDGEPVQMDVAPEIIEPGRAMLPLRWAVEALGRDIYWDESVKQVKVLN
jgi:hypothetical protein